MTADKTFIPGAYRQHILAGVIGSPASRPVGIDTHGGGPGADGSYITATFGAAADDHPVRRGRRDGLHPRPGLADEHQWIFDRLPAEIPHRRARQHRARR